MTNEKHGITGNTSDVIYEHVMQRFNRLVENTQTESISFAMILQEMETIQILIHAEGDINSKSNRVTELINRFEQIPDNKRIFDCNLFN